MCGCQYKIEPSRSFGGRGPPSLLFLLPVQVLPVLPTAGSPQSPPLLALAPRTDRLTYNGLGSPQRSGSSKATRMPTIDRRPTPGLSGLLPSLLGLSALLCLERLGVAAQGICDGAGILIQPGVQGISGATLNDRTPVAAGGPNLMLNGDFSFNITWVLLSLLSLHAPPVCRFDSSSCPPVPPSPAPGRHRRNQDMNGPNTARGPLPQETQSFQPLYSAIKDWIGSGGGTFSYPMWGGKTATQYKTGWYPVAQQAGASLSSIYMGTAFAQYNGTPPTFDANGYGVSLDPKFYIYSAYNPQTLYASWLTPVNITQVVTGLVVGRTYRLQFFQGGEGVQDGPTNAFNGTGIAALDISGYDRVYFLVSGLSAQYRSIDFVAKSTSHVLSFLNWGHVEITGPPNTFPPFATELAFDDVILVPCPSCTKAATAWTTPGRKVAPLRTFT